MKINGAAVSYDVEPRTLLVHFIRELPRLTPERIEQMKALNPQSPEQLRQPFHP